VLVPFPYRIPYCVNVPAPVPPLGTVRAEPSVKAPVVLRVVNAPVEAVLAPIGVLLMEPPVIAALDDPKVFAVTRPVPKVTGSFVVVSIESVPVAESIIGALAFSVRFPLSVLLPVTAKVEFKVVAPVTPSVVPIEAVVVVVSVVNLPVEGLVAPIGVLLIDPPVMVAPDEAKVFAVVEPLKLFAPAPVCV
jgi:hypothetical protein